MASIINASNSGFGGIVSTGDSSGQLQLQTAGTTALTIDTSQRVGIGTASPSQRLDVQATTGANILKLSATTTTNECYQTFNNAAGAFYVGLDNSTGATFGSAYSANFYQSGAYPMIFWTNNAERMRIDSSGNLIINSTSRASAERVNITVDGNAQENLILVNTNTSAGNNTAIGFRRAAATTVGTIVTTTSSTAYNTSSDYRLKENIAPMTGALATVSQLKPVTYKWKIDGSDGQGFIAHELQEIVPEAVAGEKDAVDEEGNIKPQGIDTSFLVATLTAAIQEQQTIINDLKARVEVLEAK